MDPNRLEDAVDRIEIRALQDAYADIVSRRRWPDLADIFLPTTVLDLDLREETLSFTGPQAVGDFIGKMVSRFEFFQFGILGTRVHLRSGGNPDKAGTRMYMTELRQDPAGHWSTIYGVYHDRLQRVGGDWKFAHRTYHSLARKDMPPVLFEFPDEIRIEDL